MILGNTDVGKDNTLSQKDGKDYVDNKGDGVGHDCVGDGRRLNLILQAKKSPSLRIAWLDWQLHSFEINAPLSLSCRRSNTLSVVKDSCWA